MTVREQTTDTPRLHGHPTEGRGHVHPGPHHQLPAALRSPDRPTAGHLPREADKRLFLRKGRSRDTLGRAGGKRRTNTKGPVFPRRGPLLTEHSWPIQEMSLTVSGSKVVGPTQENATTLGRRRTDVGQALRGLTPAPTAGLWLIPLCPGLFQSLISWPGASPSQPRDIPQREHAGEASGVSGARGAAQRAVPPHTAQASPGGASGARPCQGHVTGVPTSPGTEAQRPADSSAGRPQPWGSGPVPSHRSCSYFRLPPKTHRAPTCSVATQAGMAPSPPLQKLPAADTLHP